MIIGFTGTRRGMTAEQMISFTAFITFFDASEFHHGDCVGADDEAANIAFDHNVAIVCHPPIETSHQANNKHAYKERPPKTHFARNRDIVDETSVLVACPCELTDQTRGGTWYTVGYAARKNKPVYIIWSDGRIELRISK